MIGDSTGCKIVEDNNYGLIVSDAQRVCINSFEEGVQLKDLGEEKDNIKIQLLMNIVQGHIQFSNYFWKLQHKTMIVILYIKSIVY